MTGKFTLKVEGDAYTDAVATADKFIETITDKLSKIQELAEANLDAVDAIADAIKHLENAKEALHGED